jgi:hypothetical protein
MRLGDDDGRHSKYPDLALGEAGAALTWFDERDGNREVYLATGTLAELRSRGTTEAHRITETPGESIGAYVAINGSRIGLAWCDNSSGAHDVYTQIFTLEGAPQTSPVRTATRAQSMIPAIRPWKNGFVTAWNELEGQAFDVRNRSEVVVSFVP